MDTMASVMQMETPGCHSLHPFFPVQEHPSKEKRVLTPTELYTLRLYHEEKAGKRSSRKYAYFQLDYIFFPR